MSVLSDIEAKVYRRIEEDAATPQFWTRAEIDDDIVDGLMEAALITGEPQVRLAAAVLITANATVQAMPANALAIYKIECNGALFKTSLWDLNQMKYDWQGDVADTPTHWFPIGLNSWGIYPQLTAPVNAALTVVQLPIARALTYTGTEVIPYQEEYVDAFADYADHALRLKDSTQAFLDGFPTYGKYLQKMSDLSRFTQRKGSLRFSRVLGAPAKTAGTEVR